ncbi:hypothetical protein KDX32_14795 [Burkholderia ambifaria]|uniref:hypothetical protein n=1 Tax=Burkholderia ambifaria TaxID=152480 RepID=UPI001B95E4E3|nr:hypothetical protein [Burkholderia ambifaria]MBR8064355.1 hypothetical protein [Burkholderia ambifaria]
MESGPDLIYRRRLSYRPDQLGCKFAGIASFGTRAQQLRCKPYPLADFPREASQLALRAVQVIGEVWDKIPGISRENHLSKLLDDFCEFRRMVRDVTAIGEPDSSRAPADWHPGKLYVDHEDAFGTVDWHLEWLHVLWIEPLLPLPAGDQLTLGVREEDRYLMLAYHCAIAVLLYVELMIWARKARSLDRTLAYALKASDAAHRAWELAFPSYGLHRKRNLDALRAANAQRQGHSKKRDIDRVLRSMQLAGENIWGADVAARVAERLQCTERHVREVRKAEFPRPEEVS